MTFQKDHPAYLSNTGFVVKWGSPLPFMKRDKASMSPQEVQRTMDFILRSQADAVIRMERWDERSDKQQQKSDDLQEKIDDVIGAVREAAKAIHDAAKSTSDHKKKIRTLEKSERQTARRVESMRDILRILTRLEARQATRLDQLEKNIR